MTTPYLVTLTFAVSITADSQAEAVARAEELQQAAGGAINELTAPWFVDIEDATLEAEEVDA